MSANPEGTGTQAQQTSGEGSGTAPPAANPPAPNPPTPQGGSNDDLTPQQMMQAIQALPEQVANAIKEQIPQPPKPPGNEGGGDIPPTPGEKPKRTSFQEFWFGNG